MDVLTVNAGSTSMKLVTVTDGVATRTWSTLDEAFAGPQPDAVAHRVVHGGERTGPVVLDDAVIAELRELTDLAPLHQPAALTAIDKCRGAWPDVAHVAAFDTAFHATIPEAARTYALPLPYRDEVRAYGFHGLSYEWATARLASVAPEARRAVIAHLGGGESLCAIRDGRSVLTTMGFTPLDGLVMATRSGAIDPGAVLWLARHYPDMDLDDVLAHRSGLVGLAGTGDRRVLDARAAAGDAEARFALDVWRHRAVTLFGGCIAALGGIDALVFTGGVGEHDSGARRGVCEGLAWAGVVTDDPDGTTAPDDVAEITASIATVRTFVIAAREDLQLAAHARATYAARRP